MTEETVQPSMESSDSQSAPAQDPLSFLTEPIDHAKVANFQRGAFGSMDAIETRRTDAAEREVAIAEFMTMPRKGWGALGDHDADERRTVLDLFGFERQLIFPTGSFPQAMAAPV